MKSFTQYLSEADYSRFLKKNKNLNDDQRVEINKYFSKENTKAGSAINWQGRDTKNMTYDDFVDIMIKYKSGFKKKLKVKVPGREGTDYQRVKLKTKGFLAYIPLNQETANFFNSGKFGTCETGHCIGWKEDYQYWDSHMIDDQEVPVYIVDGRGKWVVIIEDGNRDYQVWDKMNQKDISIKDREPIPGFSIKKELMNSRMAKLYDDIREEFYTDDDRHEEAEPDFSDAQDDYDNLVNAIESARQELEDARENQEAEMEDIRQRTLKYYDKKREATEPLSNELEEKLGDLQDLQDKGDAPYKYDGKIYSQEEMDNLTTTTSNEFDDAYEEYSKWDDGYTEIDDMSTWDMYENHDEYEWQGEVPDEDGQYEYNINIPDVSYYDDYVEYLENYHGIDPDNDDIKQAIWSYIYEGGYRRETASTILAVEGLYRP